MTWFPIDRCYAHALGDPLCREINVCEAGLFAAWSETPDRCYTGPLEVGEYYGLGELLGARRAACGVSTTCTCRRGRGGRGR